MGGLVNIPRCAVLGFAVAAALGSYCESRAAFNITTTNVPITENFNTFAGTNATIPANFAFAADSVTGVERNLFNPATQAYTSNNGLYALYFSSTNDSSDRAFGTKRQPNGIPATLTWAFVNQTGIPLLSFDVSWTVEQYTAGGRPTTIDFSYNPNSTGYTQTGITGTTLTTAQLGTPISGVNLASPINTSRLVSITLGTPLANGQSIDFRWTTLGVTGNGANAHIGVDNTSVTTTPEPSAALAWFGVLMTCGMASVTRVGGMRRAAFCFADSF